ncbi:unnamed protein product [Arabidopsis thaliana]|uniref:Uncharacterized protein n=2 Tax=Arabidopsis TaxID=3701 RepID=A0A654EAM6_ARATH|nr:SET domain [Arabidopsis suecica]VYS46413.1 unnamed protein product [Arabidopsis thaliana]
MDKSIPIKAIPVACVRPDLVDDVTKNTSTIPTMVSPVLTNMPSATSPLLMVPPLRTIWPSNKEWYDGDAGPSSTGPIKREASDNTNDTAHNTFAPPPEMVIPLNTIRPSDDSSNNSCDAGAGPSTGPVKRGRGRPKGSKNSTSTEPKKPKVYDPNSLKVTSRGNFDSEITEAETETGNQEIVDSVMMRFDAVRRRLCQINHPEDILTTASGNCTKMGVKTNTRRRIGAVPGIHVGDIFYYWGEMCLVGLHKSNYGGIDFFTAAESAVEGHAAMCVVTAGQYDDETEGLDTLIYSGQGGTDVYGNARDQEMKGGNLALEASVSKGNDVRVVRGVIHPHENNQKIYIYDGMYLVSKFWTVTGKSGFKEFRFKLVRKPNQPPAYAIWKTVENLRNHDLIDSRQGFILEDLSFGAELLRVPLVNEVDEDDKTIPEDFDYIPSQCHSGMMTHEFHFDRQSLGCQNCRHQPCMHQNCTCVQRNGDLLPYHNNILVCRKPLIYECGGSCPCPDHCPTRLVQTGLKLHLEVFKTRNCGWGLRSWDPIRAGTFICEFAGLRKTKEEVEEDDDYLFDTSKIYQRFRWNYEPELLLEDSWEQVSEFINLPTQVLISAKEKGNVGRFMNHSCSPNVFWQPIEYENRGDVYLLIGLFAMKHIPPMTELTYDYGVSCVERSEEDEVLLYKGKKTCLCGSVKCRGSFT